MPSQKKRGHQVKVKTKILSSVKMAVALVFLGMAALAAAAAFLNKTEKPSSQLWCAYGSEVNNPGLGIETANYCGSVQSQEECLGLFRGQPFTTLNECEKYLTSVAK